MFGQVSRCLFRVPLEIHGASLRPTSDERNPLTQNREARFAPISSIQPVLDSQAGHLGEVGRVAGQERGVVRESDAGDFPKLRTSNFFLVGLLLPVIATKPNGLLKVWIVLEDANCPAPILFSR